MQSKAQLIYNDICALAMLGCSIYRWGQDLQRFWMLMFVYFFIKQIIAHKEYYKVNNRLF